MDLFTLLVKIGADTSEYDKALNDAEGSASSFGSSAISKIGGGLATAAKVGAAAVGAASTAVGAMTKSAVDGYSEYEQLWGGVQKLYGTAGQTLEEFSASATASVNDLKNSTVDWTKYIKDEGETVDDVIGGLMEDLRYNIEEIHTPIEELQDYLHFEYDLDTEDAMAAIQAYKDAISDEGIEQSFQRHTEAQELMLKNANEAYATAGMSANRYMETATSFSAALINSLEGDTVKAAEQTDVAMRAIADNYNTFGSDMTSIENAFMGFAKQNYTMLDNLKLGYGGTKQEMERLIEDANAYAQANGEAADLTIESFSDIVTAIQLIQEKQNIAGTTSREAASTVAGSIGSISAAWENLIAGMANPDADLDQLIENVVVSAEGMFENMLPVIERALEGVGDFVAKIAPVIAEKLPELVETVLPSLLDAATSLLNGLVEALPSLMEILLTEIPNVVTSLGEGLQNAAPQLLESASTIVSTLVEGLTNSLPEMIPAAVEMILALVTALTNPDNIAQMLNGALMLAMAILEGLLRAIPEILNAIPQLISNLVGGLVAAIPIILAAAVELFNAILTAFIELIPQIVLAIPRLILAIVGGITKGIKSIAKVGKDLVGGLWKGIKERWSGLVDDFKNLASGLVDRIKGIFGIHSPSKVFAEIGKNIDEGMANGIENNIVRVDRAFSELADFDAPTVQGSVLSQVAATTSDNRDMTVILELDKMQLARAVYSLNQSETQRVGLRLAGGY